MSRSSAVYCSAKIGQNALTDTGQARLQTKLLQGACCFSLVQATKQATLYPIVDLRTARCQTRSSAEAANAQLLYEHPHLLN